MNVIVSNKYYAMLENLNIDLIKSINGEFEIYDLISQFQNFFFNKMILDITAIRNYEDITQIQKLSFGLDMSKIILLLDNDSEVVNSPEYISELVSFGIYNFTKNINAIPYLIDNPNSYKDVAQFHLVGVSSAPQSSGEEGASNREANERNFINESVGVPQVHGTRVIGFKNLTDHAGASTLVYMLKKQLSANYSVLGIELDKNDYLYFNDDDLKSISSGEFDSVVNNPINNYQVILVDVNDSQAEAKCTEMFYLIEPSTLMLNKMIKRDRNILDKIKGKKVILNRSLLEGDDIKEFEAEARCTVFQNIPPLDDHKDRHRVLDEFLSKIGFAKNAPATQNKGAKLFGIVKE